MSMLPRPGFFCFAGAALLTEDGPCQAEEGGHEMGTSCFGRVFLLVRSPTALSCPAVAELQTEGSCRACRSSSSATTGLLRWGQPSWLGCPPCAFVATPTGEGEMALTCVLSSCAVLQLKSYSQHACLAVQDAHHSCGYGSPAHQPDCRRAAISPVQLPPPCPL